MIVYLSWGSIWPVRDACRSIVAAVTLESSDPIVPLVLARANALAKANHSLESLLESANFYGAGVKV